MNIKGFIEWIGHDLGSATATVFPYLLFGLVGLYVLYLLIGYLRVSQVGIAAERHAEPVLALPPPKAPAGEATETRALAAPRGVAYCPTDALQFPPTARFCPVCEGDVMVDCANCGTTIRAADGSCYHCGTRQIFALASDED
jgi:hypothetical protein